MPNTAQQSEDWNPVTMQQVNPQDRHTLKVWGKPRNDIATVISLRRASIKILPSSSEQCLIKTGKIFDIPKIIYGINAHKNEFILVSSTLIISLKMNVALVFKFRESILENFPRYVVCPISP